MTTNDFDPTTNRIPFGLLTDDEQNALIHWPHGFEHYHHSGWDHMDQPSWINPSVYRGKPAPVVESIWFNVYPYGPSDLFTSSREKVDEFADPDRIAVLRIDTCNGVTTSHLEEV